MVLGFLYHTLQGVLWQLLLLTLSSRFIRLLNLALEVQSNIPGEKPTTYDLTKPVINIGRDPSNDLVIDAPVVSGFHAQIVREGNQLILIHPHPSRSHTTNGLLYQGLHILGNEPFRKPLVHGDIFRIGDEQSALVTLIYYDGSGAPQEMVPGIRPLPVGAPVSTPCSQSPHPQAQPLGKQQEQANHQRSRSRRVLPMPESIDTSLVRIRTIGGGVVGAGFLVGKCQVLTCAHVVAQALDLPETSRDPPLAPIVLDFPLLAPRTRLAARVVFWCPVSDDGSGDIAGLELLGDPLAGAEMVHFTPAEDVWEHSFRAFGFPAGHDDGVWATGRLLGRQATNWLLLEDVKTEGFAVVPGFSGGPVWDTRLQGVVGMVVASSRPAETKTAFVIPFDVLATAWPCLEPIMHQRVFLSAAPADMPFAKRLSADLRAQGIVVWDEMHGPVDTETDAQECVQQAIRAAQAVLLVVSSQTRTSRTVKEHLHLANLYQRRLILAWVGDDEHTQPPLAGWPDTVWVDAQNTPYETVLKNIEAALSQSRSRSGLLGPPQGEPEQVPRNPYKGLHPFTANDVGDFFGRERLVNDLVNDVTTLLAAPSPGTECGRCLTIIGPSGSGKSSVVMAGLLPRLQHGAVPGSDKWVYLEPMIPGKHPLEALTLILKPHFPDSSFKTLREDLEDDATQGLHLLATQLVKEQGKERGSRVVLLVDQFEEVFTQTETEDERQRFLDLLLTAATTPCGPLLVLLTLRADFYDRPMQYPSLSRLILAHQRQVLPMDVEDLRATIEQPAALPDVQLSFEGNLVGDLLFEVQGQIGALPLLQFTLDQLFERRDGQLLTLSASHEIGGVKGALSQHAEQTYTALPSEEHRRLARALFLRLMEPGASEQDTTRRRATLSEFAFDDPAQTRLMRETIDAFVAARLLTASEVAGTTTLEVSHEAVLREWKQIADWLHEAHGDILLQQDLSKDAAEWEQRKHPRDRLYRGAQLEEAQAWTRRNRPSKQEVAFLRASAAQRTLQFTSIVVLLLLLLTSAGVAGWFDLTRPPNPTLVTTLQDNVAGSLRYCIANASSGSTIRFAQGLSGTIELTGGGLVFTSGKQLTIKGPGANQLTISGGPSNPIIHASEAAGVKLTVSKGATLNILDLSFKNGVTASTAFLYNEGTLTVTNSIISNNTTISNASSNGGGISNIGGTLTVINSVLSNNVASSNSNSFGGGIYNEGKLTVIHSIFSKNKALGLNGTKGFGGAIFNASPPATAIVEDSTFSDNLASGGSHGQGGGIDNEDKLTVIHSIFLRNTALGLNGSPGLGGGICNVAKGTAKGIATVTDSTFSGNSATDDKQGGRGGGIENGGKLTVTQSTFSNNSARGSVGFGGGIFNENTGTLMVTTSTFSGNSASGKQNGGGGGITNVGRLTLVTSTFWNNSANSSGGTSFGGGIWAFGLKGSSAIIRFCTIYKNTSSAGGGIWADPTGSSHLTISSSIIAANSAHDGPDISGTLTSNGYNLLTNITGVTGLDAVTDKQVTLANLMIDSTLGNNGGPTQTLALQLGSPAIDVVPGNACSITVTDVSGHMVTITTDQRDDPRPDDSEDKCDIGAFESSY